MKERVTAREKAMQALKLAETGEYLYAIRHDKDMSLAQVAKPIGISANYLSEIERGAKSPSSILIRQIAKFYELDEDDLFRRLGRVPLDAVEQLEESVWLQTTLSELRDNRKLSDEEREEMEEELLGVYKKFLAHKEEVSRELTVMEVDE